MTGWAATVFDPGMFDPAVLLAGERTRVSGHDAWYRPDHPPLALGGAGPVLGWQDRSGSWILASRPNQADALDRAELTRFAAAVRLGPPRDLLVPFRLGDLPDGWRITRVSEDRGRGSADLAGPGGAARVVVYPVSISPWFVPTGPGTGQLVVGGHPAWYRQVKTPDTSAGTDLGMLAGTCNVRLVPSGDVLDLAAATRIARAMTFPDCEDRSTWTGAVR